MASIYKIRIVRHVDVSEDAGLAAPVKNIAAKYCFWQHTLGR
jgi:hypothetical protein